MVGKPTRKRLNLLMGGGKMSFTYLFYKHIMFRSSCGNCHYCNTKRPSDITIADFWRWEKTDSKINKDDKGVSLILVNTDKGRELFDKIKNRMTVIPAKMEDCMQHNLMKPTVLHPRREEFESDYTKYGVPYVLKKDYYSTGLKAKIKNLILLIRQKLNLL